MGSYVPNTEEDREEMLSEMGYSSMDDLFSSLPEEVRFRRIWHCRKESLNLMFG